MKLPKRNKIYKNKNININKKYKQSINWKPDGLWYSCYNEWYDFLIDSKINYYLHKYIHKININKNIITNIRNKNKDKLLVIKNMKDLNLFNKIYGLKFKMKINGNNKITDIINWIKVSQDYGGIEICPFLSKGRKYLWYSTWDIGSGCLWNTKAIIKNTELIYEMKNGKYISI